MATKRAPIEAVGAVVPATFQRSNQRRQKAAASRDDRSDQQSQTTSGRTKDGAEILRATSPQLKVVLRARASAGKSRKRLCCNLELHAGAGISRKKRAYIDSIQAFTRARAQTRSNSRTRAKPSSRAVERRRTDFSGPIARESNLKKASRVRTTLRGPSLKQRSKRILTVKVEGQAGQLSITPCASAAASNASAETIGPLPPWGKRAGDDLASKRKRGTYAACSKRLFDGATASND